MNKHILAIVLLVFFGTLHAQLGNLDPSFGHRGLVQTDFDEGNVYDNDCKRILTQSDGSFYLVFEMNRQIIITRRKPNGAIDLNYGQGGYSVPVFMTGPSAIIQQNGQIVVGGTILVDGPAKFGLARFNKNGELDKSFGLNGLQKTSFSGISDNLTALALQADGKLVAAGRSYDFLNDRIVIARYNADGSMDNSFSGDGKQTTTVSGYDAASAVTLQRDGKIVVAGYSNNSGIYSFLVARYFVNGSPDSNFAANGILTLTSGSYSIANSVISQIDGKIIVGGFSLNSSNQMQCTVFRLLENGTRDSSFSTDGQVTERFGGGECSVSAMAVQTDGKLLITGFASLTGAREFIAARYSIDGTLDNSFSDIGFLVTSINTGGVNQRAEAESIVLLPGGSIMVAGFCGSPRQYAVVRLNPEGRLDNSFDGDGVLKDHKSDGQSVYNASAVQPDGKLVTTGQAVVTTQGQMAVIVARYNADGSVDRHFSAGGKKVIEFPYPSANGNAVAIQHNGKIVVAGTAYNGTSTDFMLLRLTRDGSLDSTFGDNGIQMTDFGGFEVGYSLVIQPDGKILLGGYTSNSNGSSFALARFKPDGNLDNSFSADGKLTTSFGTNTAEAHAVLLQQDGKIVAVGNAMFLFAVARYNADGSADLSFDGDGQLTTGMNGLHAQAYSAVLSPDGEITAAGSSEDGFMLARYKSTGALDHNFSGDGILTLDFGEGSEVATSLVLQPDGKLIAGGTVFNGYKLDFALARINKAGTPDSSFSGDGKIVLDIGNGEDAIQSLSIDRNRLYAAGRTTYGGQLATVAAFNIGCALNVQIPDAFTLARGVKANTVYPGYAPAQDITLSAVVYGGKAPFTYHWSSGDATASITVTPRNPGVYSVTAYDVRGCSNSVSKQVNVVDITCGGKDSKVLVCHQAHQHLSNKGRVSCISVNAVAAALKNGAYLGNCDAGFGSFDRIGNFAEVEVYPNPANTVFHVLVKSAENEALTIIISDGTGRLIETIRTETNKPLELGGAYRPGMYFFEIIQGSTRTRGKLVKNSF